MNNLFIIYEKFTNGLLLNVQLRSGVNKRFYSTSGNKRFGSTSPSSVDKLWVNSSLDNLVFTKYDDNSYRSVFYFPPLQVFEKLLAIQSASFKNDFALIVDMFKHQFTEEELMASVQDFSIILDYILFSLDPGYYKFEIYFYQEGRKDKNLSTFYTVDFSDKNCLNKVVGGFGYTVLADILIRIEADKDLNISEGRLSILGIITHRLCKRLLYSSGTFDLKKKTLLSITKTNEEFFNSVPNSLVPLTRTGGFNPGNKRSYSTSGVRVGWVR